jgi:flagellar hook-basal body complex protein FliE
MKNYTSDEQKEKLEEIREACDPANDSLQTLQQMLNKAVWYQVYTSMRSLGQGYAESMSAYKEDFQTFIDDMKKAGVDTGKMYKQMVLDLKDAFIKKWNEIRAQVKDIPIRLSTITASLSNPFTLPAGILGFYGVLEEVRKIKHMYFELSCILLDYELYRMDEADVEQIASVGKTFDKIINAFIISGQGFVYIEKAVNAIYSVIGTLANAANNITSVAEDVKERLVQKATDRIDASPFLMSETKKLSDSRKGFCGYLFECITIEIQTADEDSGEVKTSTKKFQYLGCDICADSTDDSTATITCTDGNDILKTGLVPITVKQMKACARGVGTDEDDKVTGKVNLSTGAIELTTDVLLFKLSDLVGKRKTTEDKLLNFSTSKEIVDRKLKSYDDIVDTKVPDATVVYKETDASRWGNVSYWYEVGY